MPGAGLVTKKQVLEEPDCLAADGHWEETGSSRSVPSKSLAVSREKPRTVPVENRHSSRQTTGAGSCQTLRGGLCLQFLPVSQACILP